MPFTRAQLRNITQHRGQAFIGRGYANYAARVAESFLRRKTYRYEDRTVSRQYALFKEAASQIRAFGLDAGDTITPDWRRRVLGYVEQRLTQASAAAARLALDSLHTSYRANYFGRLWLMDSATLDTVSVRKPPPPPYPLDSDQVLEAYETEAVAGILKIRRLLAASLTNGDTPAQAMRAVTEQLGVRRDGGRGVWYKTQLWTRTYIIEAANIGALMAYRAQADALQEASERSFLFGVMWLSSRDNRVCPTCRRLDGRVWILSEMIGMALTGLPPTASHGGCRCGIVPIFLPNFFKRDNKPPEQTLREWLEANGYDAWTGDFLDDSDLDSSQI